MSNDYVYWFSLMISSGAECITEQNYVVSGFTPCLFPTSLERPKSPIFIIQPSIRMFFGFKSRWIIPWPWKCKIPLAIWKTITNFSTSVSEGFPCKNSWRSPSLAKWSTINTCLFSSEYSISLIIFWWFNLLRWNISLFAFKTYFSFNGVRSICLTAYFWWVWMCSAR